MIALKTLLTVSCFAILTFGWRTSTLRSGVSLKKLSMTSTITQQPLDSENTIASNLKVPSTAWKWPKSWPFPPDYLEVEGNANTPTEINESLLRSFITYLKFSSEENNLYIGSSKLNLSDFSITSSQFLAVEELSQAFENVEDDYFDNIAILIGVESMTTPTEIMQQLWRVLKPKGSCFILFSGKPQLTLGLRPIKMWTTMTDEQKIWIAGSYFHYSCYEGWDGIEGYDLLGTTGSERMKFDIQQLNQTGQASAYSVQAKKVSIEDFHPSKDFNSTLSIFSKRLLGFKNLKSDDRKFLSYRLTSLYGSLQEEEEKRDLLRSSKAIEQIYETLKEVKEVVIPSPVKASLSSSIFREWENSPDQVSSLRMALGLDPPSVDFWLPVSVATKSIGPKEKIYFLADLIPKFGKKQYSDRLEQFPSLLSEVLTVLTERLPTIEEKQLQLFASDLMISDFLKDEESSHQKIVRFVRDYPISKLENIVTTSIP